MTAESAGDSLVSEHHSSSPEETERLGRQIAEQLRGGGVVFLRGPLGAGKTWLAKALFAALGVDPNRVTSPTFQLVNRYRSARDGMALHHIDLYRIERTADLETLGLDDVFDAGGVVVIEWAERLSDGWIDPDLIIDIEVRDDDSRLIRVVSRRGAAPT